MKKFKTTGAHGLLRMGLILEEKTESGTAVFFAIIGVVHLFTLSEINDWLEKGWIKDISNPPIVINKTAQNNELIKACDSYLDLVKQGVVKEALKEVLGRRIREAAMAFVYGADIWHHIKGKTNN